MRTLHTTVGMLCVLSTGCYSGMTASADTMDTDGPSSNGTSGSDDGSSEGDGSGNGDDTGPSEADCDDAAFSVSAAPLRGLTRAQFRNSVEDILGPSDALDEAMGRLDDLVDGKAGQFTNNTTNPDKGVARTYMLIAENLAGVIGASPGVLPECALGDAACVEPFLQSFGARVYRRPLRADELERYMGVWATQRDAHDGATGVRAALTVMFASPNFLYIEEPVKEGEGDFLYIEDYGLASRLSYYLWQSGPDEELLTLAGYGTLQDDDILAAQVDRMMDDPRFSRTLESFHQQLVGIDRIETFETDAAGWSDTLREEMLAEVGAFARFVFEDSQGTIDELLTADYSIGNTDLAALYGATADDDGFIALDSSQRSGMLTLLGILTMTSGQSQEVHRGLFVRRALMCEHPPELTPEQQAQIVLDPTVNRLETAPCRGCHIYSDLVGFGLAKYGSLGEYLDDDAIEDAGEIVPLQTGLSGSFEGARELGQLLAGDDNVERCFATQWSRYATQRLETSEDTCALQQLGDQTVETEGDLRTLIRSIALSPRFRVRRADSFTE